MAITHDTKKEVKPPETSGSDEEGRREALEFLEEENKYKRREQTFNLFHRSASTLFIVISFIAIVAVIIVAWHLLAPCDYHWLTTEQYHKLITILSSGAVSVLASTYFNKYFKG